MRIRTQNSVSVGNVLDEKSRQFSRERDFNRVWYSYAKKLVINSGISKGYALDVGCGVGEFMSYLSELGFNVIGIDKNPDQIRRIEELGFNAKLVNLENPLPFEKESFQLIACLEVIEHVNFAESLLLELSRILTPEGCMLISTPNFSFWRNRITFIFGNNPANEGIHLRFWNASILENKLSEAGFLIKRRMSISPVTGLNFISRLLGYRDNFFVVPRLLENLLAYDLIYQCKKKPRPS